MVTTLVINEKVAKLQFPSAQFPHHPDDDDGPCNDLPPSLPPFLLILQLRRDLSKLSGFHVNVKILNGYLPDTNTHCLKMIQSLIHIKYNTESEMRHFWSFSNTVLW